MELTAPRHFTTWLVTRLVIGAAVAAGMALPMVLGVKSLWGFLASMAVCLIAAGWFTTRRLNREPVWGDLISRRTSLLVVGGMVTLASFAYLMQFLAGR